MLKKIQAVFFVASVATLPLATLFADDWPQFLGPHRTGVSSETGLIEQFPDDGPTIVWRRPGGVGMASFAVVGERACTLIQDAGNQWLLCLDVKTGQSLWQFPIAKAYLNPMGDGPRATPLIEKNVVYALSGEGILCAKKLDSGEPIWSVDTPEKLGGKVPEYGMACSPLVHGNAIIVTVGAPDACVGAFEKSSGELLWTAGSETAAGYSSPAILNIGDQRQLVVFAGNKALGIDPANGTELWSYEFVTDYNCNIATPLLIGEHLLLSSGENHGTVLLSVPSKPGGTAKEIWTSLGNRSVLRNEWQTSLLVDNALYGFDNIGSAGPITNSPASIR